MLAHRVGPDQGRHQPQGVCSAGARGDLVSDAVIAALAIEAGATVVTYDRDFARFRDVRWCTPGESAYL